ncbi:auxin response factor 3 [Carex littledalei]|uniref:Auxin response factor n=1 Tax=Carex littledalei TaxID=544730 RepID=A0A833QXE4_9POAL|nr:auxin response factor 3 [Carex littledalei]
MGIDLNTVEEEEEEAKEEDAGPVCLELWHACAGPSVSLPNKGYFVVYFPQGHAEQLGDFYCGDVGNGRFDVPLHVFCRVVHVRLHADVETDEVYAQLALMAVSEEEIPKDGDGGSDESDSERRPARMPHMFCKTLTASDTSTHGGFSVPRRAAEDCFPPLDYKLQRPSQELVAKDLHGTEWRFRHIYRGQPRRHLLTTGWSAFVNKKKLVSGDAVLFLRGEDGELRLGIRRAGQLKDTTPFPVLHNQSSNHGTLATVAHALYTKSVFNISYNPRDGHSSFIIPYWKFVKSFSHPISIGMRFKMRCESEDASERRCTGLITGIGDMDPLRWPGSKWRCLLVRWDEGEECRKNSRISPWEIEPNNVVAGSPGLTVSPISKRLKPNPSTVGPEFPVCTSGNGYQDYSETSRRFQKVLQGQEYFSVGIKSSWDRIPVATPQPQSQLLGAGFPESVGFQKVLQGQEIHPCYHTTLTLAGTIAPYNGAYRSRWTPALQVQGYANQVSPSHFVSRAIPNLAIPSRVNRNFVSGRKDQVEMNTTSKNKLESSGGRDGCRIFGFSLNPVIDEVAPCQVDKEFEFEALNPRSIRKPLGNNCATVKCP